MALCGKIVDLGGLRLLDDADDVRRIGHIAIMEEKGGSGLMGIDIKMVDPLCVEGGGSALNAMNYIPLLDQKFGKIAPVLPGDARDERRFACRRPRRIASRNQCKLLKFIATAALLVLNPVKGKRGSDAFRLT